VFAESSSKSSGLLGSKVNWLVLLALVELSDLRLLGLVDDVQGLGDGLSHDSDLGELGGSARAGNLGDSERVELLLGFVKLGSKFSLGLSSEIGGLNLGHSVRSIC